ncbi:VWA domain-containing protein [uncultured Pseudoteredinibacter sp.]|uniref:VWA domain-containing protein n=1 Tax=uncultured Pseudoteredinibacter sp. TaxID=1641701 RepID=UPI002633F81A|nr:VWA domain-containing protein [uncultured Pseudoteredinibacter sp.]
MPQYRRLLDFNLASLIGLTLLLGLVTPLHGQVSENTQSMPAKAEVVLDQEERLADVRLLIDVSGSMKLNDPANLRQPAIDLLVKLLPEGSKAGVWSFGKYVNMLVPHQAVSEDWKSNAASKADGINSSGLFTNIGLALEKASYDIEQNGEKFDRHLILLTDGMVDIAKDPDANQVEWQRIANDLLPKLQAAGFSIHTIALSENADSDLLQQLSRATDGHSAVAQSADELMQAFLQAFDKAAPAEQLPFDGESFLVDSSVEEFTALIFNADTSQKTTLIAPDSSRYSAARRDDSVNWYAGEGYDLVTVQHPFEGEWQVKADVAENSRITVVSGLSLKVRALPNNINPGEIIDLIFSLRQEGKVITDPEFLSLLDIDAQLSLQAETRKQWNYKIYSSGAETPEQGIFQRQLEDFAQRGQYLLKLNVDGKSFQRSFSHRFNSQAAFQAKLVESENEEGKPGYLLTVSGANKSLDLDATTVDVTLVEQDGNQRPFVMELGSRNNWQLFIPAMADGLYQFEMVVSGKYQSGEHLRYNLPPLSLVLDGDSMSISDAPLAPEAAAVEVSDDEGEALEDEPLEEQADHNWLLYGLLALGNLLVFVLLYMGYRFFIMEKPEAEEEEEEDEDFVDVNAVVDDSELPVEEAIAEVKETIAAQQEQAQQTPESAEAATEQNQDETAQDAEQLQEQSPTENAAEPAALSMENDMGDPEAASIGDDILAMDDLDSDDGGSGATSDDGAETESAPLEAAVPVTEANNAEGENPEPPVLDQAVETAEEPQPATEETQQDEAPASAAEETGQATADAPVEEPNIEDEIDALLEQGSQVEEDDEDWAAALQNELDGVADGTADNAAAEEVATDLSESLDLADDAVADADLTELSNKKDAEQG